MPLYNLRHGHVPFLSDKKIQGTAKLSPKEHSMLIRISPMRSFKQFCVVSFFIAVSSSANGGALRDGVDLPKIGYCTGVFGNAMNSYALNNQIGGVNLMSLHYGRSYATYAAFALNTRKKDKDVANTINHEIAEHARTANRYLGDNPMKLTDEANSCINYIAPLFEELALKGVKLDDGYSETIVEFASALAKQVRNDLGYK